MAYNPFPRLLGRVAQDAEHELAPGVSQAERGLVPVTSDIAQQDLAPSMRDVTPTSPELPPGASEDMAAAGGSGGDVPPPGGDLPMALSPDDESKVQKAMASTGLSRKAALAVLGLGSGGVLAYNMMGDNQPPPPQAKSMSPSGTSPATPQAAPQIAPPPDEYKKVQGQTNAMLKQLNSPEAIDKLKQKSQDITLQIPPSAYDQSGSVEALKDAQHRQNLAVFGNQLGRAASQVGAGMARVQPGDLSGFDQNVQQAGQITQQLKDQIEREGDDPNSPISQAMKQYAQKFGVNIQGNISAKQLDKMMPYIFKGFEAEETRKQQEVNKRLQILGIQSQRESAAAQHDLARTDKMSHQYDQNLNQAQTQLEQSRGNKALNNSKETIRRVDNALAIINRYPNPDDIPKNLASIVTSDLGTIVNGGVMGEHGYKELANDTLWSGLAKRYEDVANKPTGANLGAFIKQNRQILEELKDNAEKSVYDYHKRLLVPKQKMLRPEDFETLKGQYLDPYESAHDDTQMAVNKYAREHGISPDQAKAIMKLRNSGQ